MSQALRTGAAVRALARDPGSAGLPGGVDVMRGDLPVPNTLDLSLDGVEAVFLLWPFLTADGAPAVLEKVRKHARRIERRVLGMRVVRAMAFGGPVVLVPSEVPDAVAELGQVVVDVSVAPVLFLDTQIRRGWGGEWFAVKPPSGRPSRRSGPPRRTPRSRPAVSSERPCC